MARIYDTGADDTLAAFSRADYSFLQQDMGWLQDLLQSLTKDDSIIKEAKKLAPMEAKKRQEIQRRNLERTGGTAGLSRAQLQEQARIGKLGANLATVGGITQGRRGQEELNTQLRNQMLELAVQQKAQGYDMLGGAAQALQARKNAYAQAKARYRSGLFSLASSALTAGMWATSSDERLKENITFKYKLAGHNIYSWDWNDKAKELGLSEAPTVGVLAQEVSHIPNAVMKDKDGYLLVDYGVLWR